MLKLDSAVVSVEWLNENSNHSDLVILDATIPKVGTQIVNSPNDVLGISNARFFDLKNKFSDARNSLPNTMVQASHFERASRQLGINTNSTIVVYDRHGIYSSARAWFMFHSMGHASIAVLDGGYPAWEKFEYPTEIAQSYKGDQGNFIARYNQDYFVSASDVLENIDTNKHILLDARSEGRFFGNSSESRTNLRKGHIPNSKSMHYAKLLIAGKMKTKEQLVELFKIVNAENHQLLLSCGSGVTACILALGAHITGINNCSVYDGSWSEWGARDDLPIATKN